MPCRYTVGKNLVHPTIILISFRTFLLFPASLSAQPHQENRPLVLTHGIRDKEQLESKISYDAANGFRVLPLEPHLQVCTNSIETYSQTCSS